MKPYELGSRGDPVPVSREVSEGMEAVRRSGITNMLDRPRVIELADTLGFHATALWIHENPSAYARGVFHGFEVEPPATTQAGAPDA